MAPFYDLLEVPIERMLYASWREHLWSNVRGPDVLEIGVGTGKNVPYYPPVVRVVAVDLSERMLRRARRTVERYPDRRTCLLKMDAQHLEIDVDTFDDVVATFVFCSVPNPVQGLREALRVARPGGRLLLLEHVRADGWPGRLMDALDPVVHWFSGVHVARRTVDNVRQAGWTIQNVTSLTGNGIFRMIEASKPH
ncbi:MAG: class I SAM-dependent methyltransferase [Rhodothermales bacterium]